MPDSKQSLTSASESAWRKLSMHQGEAIEAYGRALQALGSGTVPTEIAIRDGLNAVARSSIDAAELTWQLGADYVRWVLSIYGVGMHAPAARPSPIERNSA